MAFISQKKGRSRFSLISKLDCGIEKKIEKEIFQFRENDGAEFDEVRSREVGAKEEITRLSVRE